MIRLPFAGCAVVLLLAATRPATAQYAWNAAGDGNWSDTTRWTPTGTPAAADAVLFNALGADGNQAVYLNGARSAASLTFSNTGTTDLRGGTAAVGATNTLTLTGGMTVNAGAGAVTVGLTGFAVTTTLSGSQTIQNNSAQTLTFSSSITATGAANRTLTLDGTGPGLVVGNLLNGAGGGVTSLVKAGSGTWQLEGNGTSNFTGDVTLTAGALLLRGSNVLGTNAKTLTVNGGVLAAVVSARTLPATLSTVVGGDFAIGQPTGTQPLTLQGTVDLGGATRTVTFNNTTAWNGVVSNGGLTKAGSLPLTLTASNTYAGPTTVTAGALTAGATNTFSPNSAVVLPAGGTLNLAGFSQVVASLSDGGGAGGSVTLGNVAAGTLTAGGNNASTTFSGTISGSGTGGGLVKAGAGTLTLTGANTYTGTTTVSGGTLAIGGATASLGAGAVTVQSTAVTLNIQAGTANAVNDSATLSLAGGGTAGVADTGFATLGAGVSETVGGLVLGGVSQTQPGTYGATGSGATFVFDDYFAGQGVIVLVPVPEPAVVGLVAAGGLGAVRLARRRGPSPARGVAPGTVV